MLRPLLGLLYPASCVKRSHFYIALVQYFPAAYYRVLLINLRLHDIAFLPRCPGSVPPSLHPRLPALALLRKHSLATASLRPLPLVQVHRPILLYIFTPVLPATQRASPFLYDHDTLVLLCLLEDAARILLFTAIVPLVVIVVMQVV